MLRFILIFCLAAAFPLLAEDESGPLISITSPDTATTFALATIKSRSLFWNDARQTLTAEVTFVEQDTGLNPTGDDMHRFRLPGVTLDKAHGIFYATSPKGEVIPIAHKKKTLFITSIEVLPNAIVRINHYRGNVTVTLEAIRPSDVARVRHQQDQETSPDGTHSVNIKDLIP